MPASGLLAYSRLHFLETLWRSAMAKRPKDVFGLRYREQRRRPEQNAIGRVLNHQPRARVPTALLPDRLGHDHVSPGRNHRGRLVGSAHGALRGETKEEQAFHNAW